MSWKFPQAIIRCQVCTRVWDGAEWVGHPGLFQGEAKGWCPGCFQMHEKQQRIKRYRAERATAQRIAQGYGQSDLDPFR